MKIDATEFFSAYSNDLDYIHGLIPDTSDISILDQDLLQASIGQYGVDVGWYPDYDPTGYYSIRTFKNNSFSDVIQESTTNIYSECVRITVREIERIIELYNKENK